MPANRRTVLKLAGAAMTVPAGGMAGCLGEDSSKSGAAVNASYDSWLWMETGDDGTEGVVFAYLDWATLREFDQVTETTSGNESNTGLGGVQDPMVASPVAGLFLVMFGAGFGLFGTGLNGLLNPPEEESGGNETSSEYDGGGFEQSTAADFSTTIDDLFIVKDVIVMGGDVDTDEIERKLTGADESEQSPGTKTFEEADSLGGYTVYEPEQSESGSDGVNAINTGDPSGFAVDENAIVLFDLSDRAQLEAAIEAQNGSRERATVTNDDFGWLVDTAGSGHLVFGGYGSELERTEESPGGSTSQSGDETTEQSGGTETLNIDGTVGLSSSLTFVGTSVTTGSLALQFDKSVDEIEDSKIEQLKEQLGSSATEQSITVDGDRLSASANWDRNALETTDSDSDSG